MVFVCQNCLSLNNLPNKEFSKARCGKCKANLLDTTPIDVNSESFNKFINNDDRLIVVDFWASWCGPCQMMAPHFMEAAKSFPLKAKFLKVNTENEQTLSAQFGIRGIPTIIIFKNGNIVYNQSGAMQSNQIVQLVNNFI